MTDRDPLPEIARRYKRMARNIARALERRAFDEDDYNADRFGGNANCPLCGLEYLEHPQLPVSGLLVTCEGQLVKL